MKKVLESNVTIFELTGFSTTTKVEPTLARLSGKERVKMGTKRLQDAAPAYKEGKGGVGVVNDGEGGMREGREKDAVKANAGFDSTQRVLGAQDR